MIINTNSIILLYLFVRSVLRNKDKQNFCAIKNKKQKNTVQNTTQYGDGC